MQLEVSLYQRSDRHGMSQLLNEATGQGDWSPWRTNKHVAKVLARDGRIWTLFDADTLVGFGLIDPIPGIDTLYDLQGSIAIQVRRQGLATYLLDRIVNDLKGSPVKQISHPVKSLTGVAAQFLLSQDFFVEHQELRLEFVDPGLSKPPKLPAGFQLQSFPAALAVSRFRHLYEDSFGGKPWYQPYQSDSDVAAQLADPSNLQFLMRGGHAAGFAWLRWLEPDEVQIEPIGLTSFYQGRGLGYVFLSAVLQQAIQHGARRICLGVWLENKPAIHIYQKAGFRTAETTTYLAYDIDAKTQMSQ